MTNIIDIYKKQLENKGLELKEILDKLTPLEQEKDKIEKEVEALKYLLESEQDRKREAIETDNEDEVMVDGPLFGMSGKEAYKEVAKNYFKDETFGELKIRELATDMGLRIKSKHKIQRNTSWGIIKELTEEGFFEKVDRGLYRYKNKEKTIDFMAWDKEENNQ